jgi:hypothetical protein
MFADKQLQVRSSAEASAARREHQLHAFTPEFSRAVHDVAKSAPSLEDLAETFPALLFALATHYGDPDARVKARDIIIAGGALREAADCIGLPIWLRRLPPEAFQKPLGHLPDDPTFSLRIANALPIQPASAARWLQSVSMANCACGPEYALWLGQHARAVNAAMNEERQLLMAAWAWFSHRPQTTAARLIRRPWTAQIGVKRATEEFNVWIQRVALADWMAGDTIEPWLPDGAALGYTFATLATADAFIKASLALDNCLDQYADRMCLGDSSIIAISKNDKLVACVEIGRHDEEQTMPVVVQVRGPRNRSATPEIWQAAYAWIGQNPIEPLTKTRLTATKTDRQRARRQLWQPYLAFLDSMPGAERDSIRMRRLISDNKPRHNRARSPRRRPV